jgi:single-stranded DNA-specific DHH superfamily exonuclease
MKSGRAAVELLITDDPIVALQTAEAVNTNNEERQKCDLKTKEEALQLLLQDPTYPTNGPQWSSRPIGTKEWWASSLHA